MAARHDFQNWLDRQPKRPGSEKSFMAGYAAALARSGEGKTISIAPVQADSCMGCPGVGYGTCELWSHVPVDAHPEVEILEIDPEEPRPELCPLRLGYTFVVMEAE